jgi:hypothetical protein
LRFLGLRRRKKNAIALQTGTRIGVAETLIATTDGMAAVTGAAEGNVTTTDPTMAAAIRRPDETIGSGRIRTRIVEMDSRGIALGLQTGMENRIAHGAARRRHMGVDGATERASTFLGGTAAMSQTFNSLSARIFKETLSAGSKRPSMIAA